MKAQISEAPRDRGRRPVDEIVLAERRAAAVEHLAALVGVPGGAAKLDHVPDAARQGPQEPLQPRQILPIHLRRKLPEHRTELFAKPQHQLEIPIEPLPRLLEPLEVGEVPAPLASEEEPPRCALPPAVDHGSGRKPVERGVHLDRVEHLGEAAEPALRRDPRVEQILPVLVDVAARSDADHDAKVVIPPPRRDRGHRLHWSTWRRRHQHRARQAHRRWNSYAETTP